jgi:pyruvate-ferredoxin/flavodoxin oxidoreductase
MDTLAERTGRRYELVEYHGAPDAERVVVLMGSGVGPVRRSSTTSSPGREGRGASRHPAVPAVPGRGLPRRPAGHRGRIAVLDRTKEPGAVGEPLSRTSSPLAEAVHDRGARRAAHVIGGRYGLSSKEFTPAMVAPCSPSWPPRRPAARFTVGIVDDVTNLSLDVDRSFRLPRLEGTWRRSSSGSAPTAPSGANKNTTKIVAEHTDRTSRPTSCTTRRSRARRPCRTCGLRRADRLDVPDREGRRRRLPPVRAAREVDVLRHPAGGTCCSTRPTRPTRSGTGCPRDVQQVLIDREASSCSPIDAYGIAREAGWPGGSTP